MKRHFSFNTHTHTHGEGVTDVLLTGCLKGCGVALGGVSMLDCLTEAKLALRDWSTTKERRQRAVITTDNNNLSASGIQSKHQSAHSYSLLMFQ